MLDFLSFLRKKYSEYINYPVRQGMIVDELAVKPTALLMTDFYNTLVDKQKKDNIDNWNAMTEDELDAFGNKFFFPRIAGSKATGVITVWMNEPQNVTIGSTFRAVAEDGLLYTALNTRMISKSSIPAATDSLNYGKYSFQIGIIAENPGTGYNKIANQIQSITGVDFDYSYVTNLTDLTPGGAHETNEMYKNRLIYSINDRSMMNKRSLYAGLKNAFPYLYSIFAAGAGSKYMTRDRLQAIDLSNPPKEAKYLGKIAGDNIVKHSAYYGVYPGEAGTISADYNGPFSLRSDYPYPQTIEAVDMDQTDPAYHGYPLGQEATDDMYRGLYYDDFRHFMEISTTDLFNISDDIVDSGDLLIPNTDWLVGINGQANGDYGTTSQDKMQTVHFNLNAIYLNAGMSVPVTVCKDVKKRVGLKATGKFTVSAAGETSVLQFVFGGPTIINTSGTQMIDSFSGLGFGVYLSEGMDQNDTSKTNATAFFCNSSRFDSTIVYSETFGGLGSLKETTLRLNSGSDYSFEYVIFDDLRMTLIIKPMDPLKLETEGLLSNFELDSSVLKYYQNSIMDINSTAYGSLMKVTLDTRSTTVTNQWVVTGMKVVDLAPHRPTALFMFEVSNLEEPLSLVFRGSGLGAVKTAAQSGHSVYIWNIETPGDITGSTLLSSGGWQRLDDVSDPNGSKDIVSQALTQNLTNIDRYAVTTRYGRVIAIMVVCEGQSYASIASASNVYDADVNASLTIDYVKLQDVQTDVYKGNNKCDVYVTSIRNSDNFRTLVKPMSRNSSEAYFTINEANGFEMPILNIETIADTSGAVLTQSQYSIIRESTSYINSVKDEFMISAPNYTDIVITYSTYNNIGDVQEYVDGPEFGKLIGDILIRHKYPTFIDISMNYYGTNTVDVMSDTIRQYFDNSVTTSFDINTFLAYLLSNKYANYIQQPITVNYEQYKEDGTRETGSITTSKTIRDIDFFRIRTLNLTQTVV